MQEGDQLFICYGDTFWADAAEGDARVPVMGAAEQVLEIAQSSDDDDAADAAPDAESPATSTPLAGPATPQTAVASTAPKKRKRKNKSIPVDDDESGGSPKMTRKAPKQKKKPSQARQRALKKKTLKKPVAKKPPKRKPPTKKPPAKKLPVKKVKSTEASELDDEGDSDASVTPPPKKRTVRKTKKVQAETCSCSVSTLFFKRVHTHDSGAFVVR